MHAIRSMMLPWTMCPHGKRKLFCPPPILTKLILDREPQRTLDWVDRIVRRFHFTHAIPGHLNNYVKATGREFAMAFDLLRSNPRNGRVIHNIGTIAEGIGLVDQVRRRGRECRL